MADEEIKKKLKEILKQVEALDESLAKQLDHFRGYEKKKIERL